MKISVCKPQRHINDNIRSIQINKVLKMLIQSLKILADNLEKNMSQLVSMKYVKKVSYACNAIQT